MTTTPCTVCGATTDAYLCASCADCNQPDDDRCNHCLTDVLAEMPARVRDLELTVARQARTHSSSQRRKADEDDPDPRSPFALVATKLPFAPNASHLLDLAENAVQTWARHICETRGVTLDLGTDAVVVEDVRVSIRRNRWRITRETRVVRDKREPTIEELATWLVENINSIRLDEAAGQMHARLTALAAEIDAVIDRRPPDLIHGRCEATVLRMVETAPGQLHPYTSVCNTALYAAQGAERVECIGCGAVYDIGDRQRMLDRVNDEWMRPKMIADALTARDEPISFDVLRKWIERDAKLGVSAAGPVCGDCKHGSCRSIRRERAKVATVDRPLIRQVGIDDEGHPLYRVGDVRARISWSKSRNETERMSA